MSLAVNTNVSSLTAHRSLAKNETLMSQAMTRLSTGLSINSASDDAAGLAIVERMTSQIKGINMAVKNANDGIGLTKSVEGALVEVTDMLQRLRELSVQSANDTNSTQDRIYIQEEVQLLLAELDRVSTNTRFNGTKVLDGNFSSQNIQVGTEGGEVITFSVDSVASSALGSYRVQGLGKATVAAGTDAADADNTTTVAEDITIIGKTSKTTAAAADDSAKDTAAAINAFTADTGVTAEAKTYAILSAGGTSMTGNLQFHNGDDSFTNKSTGNFTWSSTDVTGAVKAINDISQYTGITAQSFNSGTQVLIMDADGDDIHIQNASAAATNTVQAALHDGSGARAAAANGSAAVTLQGTGNNDSTTVSGTLELYSNESFQVTAAGTATLTYFAASTVASLNATSAINLKTQNGASSAIRVIDGAIEKVSSMRAELGAIENRLSHTISNLMNVSEQTSNSRSLLQDANFAVESSNLSKAQVLMQAATAMLAQANARPQLALQLLQG